MNKSTFLDHAMFKKKQIDREMPDSNSSRSLSRTLSTFDLVMLGIGGIIGMGIFVLSGLVAGLHAGNALPLSFVFAGVACLFAALCYAEFSAMIPLAGSAYTYCYMTLGEIWAWIIGWDLILEYGLAVSAVAIGWSGYLGALLRSIGLYLPPAFLNPPGTEGGIINLPAVGIVLCLSLLLVQGDKKERTNQCGYCGDQDCSHHLFHCPGPLLSQSGELDPLYATQRMAWDLLGSCDHLLCLHRV